MELQLDNSSLVKEIGQSFNKVYPYLKIEIFNYASKGRKAGVAEKPGTLKSIGRLLKLNQSGKINIDKNRTVAQLEKDFRDQFNLFVQVFRKSGNLWIETTLTEDWTLERRNKRRGNIHTPGPQKSLEERLEDLQFDMD